jgi:pilus assembly protein CpaC
MMAAVGQVDKRLARMQKMSLHAERRSLFRTTWWTFFTAVFCIVCSPLPLLRGQPNNSVGTPTGSTLVSKQNESIQIMINSTHTVTTEEDIERAGVHNDAIVSVRPMARNELMVSAKATGVTQIDLYGPNKQVRSVQVVVIGDARELDAILRSEFPMANLHLRPIQNAIIISGQVTSDQHVEQAVAIAEQFYPTVINRIEVIGVHTVMLHAQVMEMSRTKIRDLGVDFGLGFGNDFVAQSVSGTIAPAAGDFAASVGGGSSIAGTLAATGQETFKFGIVDNGNSFFGTIRALHQRNLIKVMADPTLVAIDGRPASFNSGGEFPILVPSGLGQVGVDFREYGTRLDFVAKVRGDGRIWLEVRPTISEIDPTRSVVIAGTSVPGLRSRYVDTAVELRAGQTLALAGLIQVRTESQTVGIPGLCDVPYLGALFRSNRELQNEVELLILVTPDFAGAMDPHEVPVGGPGYNSFSPSDKELYWKGYIETPAACPPGGFDPMMSGSAMPIIHGEQVGAAPVMSNSVGVQGSYSVDPAAYRISTGGLPALPAGYVSPQP